MERTITDIPFYENKNPVEAAIAVIEETGFFKEEERLEREAAKQALSEAIKVVKHPFRSAMLHRYREVVPEYRNVTFQIGMFGGVLIGVGAGVVTLLEAYVTNGQVTNGDMVTSGMALLTTTSAGIALGEVTAHLVALIRSCK